MNNLSELLVDRRQTCGDRPFGLVGDHEPFRDAFDRAARLATLLGDLAVQPGQRVAVIGTNSRSYLAIWMALQLAGVETALLNPTYPPELLAEMVSDLEPDAITWIGTEPQPSVGPQLRHLDASRASDGEITAGGAVHAAPPQSGPLPGLARQPSDTAGYMHTSGTTGTPKFCAQTHEYFLRLGRFIADSMSFSERDVVFAPLPLFHINPLGYGVIGGLVGRAGVLSSQRFSASRFWSEVRAEGVTALVLHGPPVEILKRTGTPADAAGHSVRITFFADAEFLDQFAVPLGVSAYGSTEAGGLSHLWLWRRGEVADLPEGMSRYGGRARHEVVWRVDDDGEIYVRALRPNVLFDGYRRRGELIRPFDADGWFATGDLGRVDEQGNLVFIERRAESIRVKGEFVPIGYVENVFAKVGGIDDLAIWRQAGELGDDEVVLFVTGEAIDVDAIRAVRDELPPFMRPSLLVRLKLMPRDDGVGKVRRRELDDAERLESWVLA